MREGRIMDRREFLLTASAAALCPQAFADESAVCGSDGRYADLQARIDEVTPNVWARYRATGDAQGFGALTALDAAFTRVLDQIERTEVTNRPAVWFVYNMGFIVKTREAIFSIDLCHPRATELVPKLDFALITHNHSDHYTSAFFERMDRSGKTVIQNFNSNYGVKDWRRQGGYARTEKTFKIKDVTISTVLTDHNDYLVDFTSAFEISVGDYTIYHTGDCSTEKKIKLQKPNPDLWIVHPRCGLKPVVGAEVIRPKKTIIAHLNEMGHARDRWRWTWANGLADQAALAAAGFGAEVPLWGDRVV